MSADRGLLGHIALQKGLITHEQLRQATREQARQPSLRLGEILIQLGFIDDAQLQTLLAAQKQIEKRKQQPRRPTPPPIKRNVDSVALGAINLKRVAKPGRKVRPAQPAEEESSARTVGFAMPREREARKESDARKWLLGILADARQCGGSDVVLRPDEPVRVRRYGHLQDLTNGPVPGRAVEPLLLDALDDDERRELERKGSVQTVYEHLEVGRFRFVVFRHLTGVAGVFHELPRQAPAITDLGLPTLIAGLTNFARGLVLTVGPSGCGKSTTLNAMLNLINGERPDHVVTIENRIECVHRPNIASFSQLMVGRDVPSRHEAMTQVPARDPDVVAIDPLMQDDELVEAVNLAESGHLVFGTLASPGSVATVERLVDAFDGSRRSACRRVADSLRAVIFQRLLPSSGDRGAAVAVEIIYVGDAVAAAIRDDAIGQIPSLVESGRSRGSRLLDDSLARLVRASHITPETAALHAHHPNNFRV